MTNVASLSTEGEANSELVTPVSDIEAHKAEEPDRGKNTRSHGIRRLRQTAQATTDPDHSNELPARGSRPPFRALLSRHGPCEEAGTIQSALDRQAASPPGGVRIDSSAQETCHNVHMKTISIRELHLKTGRWVRQAATRGPIVVTDRGRRVAALQPFDESMTGRPLPNREAAIRKRSKIPVDSAVYQSELREDR